LQRKVETKVGEGEGRMERETVAGKKEMEGGGGKVKVKREETLWCEGHRLNPIVVSVVHVAQNYPSNQNCDVVQLPASG